MPRSSCLALSLLVAVSACKGRGTPSGNDTGTCGSLELSATSLPADGVSTITAYATVADPCASQTSLATTAGTLAGPEATGDGRLAWTLTASNLPGTAALTLTVPDAEASSAEVVFEPGFPTGVQMHLHGPISEGDTTHAYQTSQAERWGIDVLWWTDHDYRYFHDWYRSPEWAFGDTLATTPRPAAPRAAWWTLAPEPTVAFEAWLDDEKAYADAPSLALRAVGAEGSSAKLKWSSIAWDSSGRRVYRPLLSQVTLRFAVWISPTWEPRRNGLRVEIPMSRVSTTTDRVLYFVDAADEGALPEGAVPIEVDWTVGGWTRVELDVSEYAEAYLEEGLDLTMRGFLVHVGVGGDHTTEVRVGGIEIVDEVCCEDLMTAQEELLAERFSEQVVQLVGQEISYDTTDQLHLTAFGSGVPFPDYELWQLLEEPHEIVADVHEYGGRVAFTHPFGVTRGITGDGDTRPLVADACETLHALDLYDADYLEVGYLERVLGLDEHLALWDCLIGEGHTATGLGTSDQHVTLAWDTYENPYVTWVLAFQEDEQGLLAALDGGRAFFGSPTLNGDERPLVDLQIPGVAAMGQIADRLAPEALTVQARVDGADVGDQIRWIVDGEVAFAEAVTADQQPEHTVVPDEWTWVRIEVHTKTGEPKLFSNPIFLSTADLDVPEARVPRP